MPEPEASPAQVALAIEEFLAAHPRTLVLEDGRTLFDLNDAKYSLASEHNRCTLHLWSEDRNLVRRVVSTRLRKESLLLSTLRFGQSKPQTLELLSDPDRRTPTSREQARQRFLPHLEKLLRDRFPEHTVDPFRSAMDLEKSFGPAYARGLLHRGQQSIAVVAVNPEESPTTIDGILTVGLLWLHACRERTGNRIVNGLYLLLPSRTAHLTLARMQWLRTETAHFRCYEYDLGDHALNELDPADTGNLASRLPYAPDAAAAHERFAAAVEKVLALIPQPEHPRIEQRLRSATQLSLLLHGLEFARIRQTLEPDSFNRAIEITVGAAASETALTAETEPMLHAFLAELFARRKTGGAIKDPLFRAQPERWLESQLLRDPSPITSSSLTNHQLDAAHLYAQVVAFGSGEHGLIDLLGVTHSGRLAVLELKASEDMHFALQALDYWVRIRWHGAQTVDPATGLGDFHRHGFFKGLRLRNDPPLLFLVAPTLRIHPATEICLRYLKPEIEWTIAGVSEHWRKQVKVVLRKRSSDPQI